MDYEHVPRLVADLKKCAKDIRETMQAFASDMGTTVERLRAAPPETHDEINGMYHAWRNSR